MIAAEVKVPEDGNYTIRFNLQSRANSNLDSDENRALVILRVDGEEFVRKEYGSSVWKDAKHETHRAWKKGKYMLTMEMQRLTPEAKPKRDLAMALGFVKIHGPADEKFWTRSPKHQQLFPQGIPEGEDEKFRFAKDWLRSLASKAFRRPADEETGIRLARIAQHAWRQPDKKFEHGIARAMEAVLASPRFLFLEESVLKSETEGIPLLMTTRWPTDYHIFFGLQVRMTNC